MELGWGVITDHPDNPQGNDQDLISLASVDISNKATSEVSIDTNHPMILETTIKNPALALL